MKKYMHMNSYSSKASKSGAKGSSSYDDSSDSDSSSSSSVKSSKSSKSERSKMKMKKKLMRSKAKAGKPSAPTPAPTIELDEGAFSRCVIAMAVSDIDRDDVMDPQEYVRFINRLNQEAFVGDSFDELDPRLQDNFNFLADTEGGIDIYGSKPGQMIADDQPLRRICTYTLTVNDQVAMEAPTVSPGSSQVSFSMCFLSLVISDLDRNEELNQAEYVMFINRYFDESERVSEFDDLAVPLQENFFQAAENGVISIAGAQPNETPTDELLDFCIATQAAVDVVMENASED